MGHTKIYTSAAILVVVLSGIPWLLVQAQSGKASGDFTFRSHMTVCGQPISDNVLMIKDGKFRFETHVASGKTDADIYDCPRRRRIQINESARTFLIQELAPTKPEEASRKTEVAQGEVTRTIDLHDTGERKDFFGYSARHVTGTIVDDGESCAKDFSGKIYSDGWYIDYPVEGCYGSTLARKLSYPSSGCKGRVNVRVTDINDPGYPVLQLTGLDEHFSMVIRDETSSVSRAPLDPHLFEAPAGYRQVNTFRDLIGNDQATR